MPKTQRHTTVLSIIVLLAILFFCFLTYQRVFLLHDYIVVGEASCDPAVESCFVYECDPEFGECTGDPEQDIWYYKQVKKLASSVPICDPAMPEECPELSCSFGEYGCEEIYCNPSNEGDACAEPGDASDSDGEEDVNSSETTSEGQKSEVIQEEIDTVPSNEVEDTSDVELVQ